MEDENLPQAIETPSELTPMPTRVNPDEMFRKIESVKDGISERLPSLWQQMTNPEARSRAIEIEKAKTSAIAARRRMIDGMTASIQVYVDTHREALKDVAQFTVSATFANMRPKLYKASEDAIVAFFRTYSTAVDEIQKIRNLTEEQKQERIRAAYERAVQAESHANATFISLVDTIAGQLREAIRKIGERY